MGRPRTPAAAVAAQGNRQGLSRAELAEREAEEVRVDLLDIECPAFVGTQRLKRRFEDLAAKLSHVGIATELDADAIGRYVVAQDQWESFTRMLRREMSNKGASVDTVLKLTRMQDTAFKQARQCAGDLGLSVTSRCRIVVPKEREKPANPFDRFVRGAP